MAFAGEYASLYDNNYGDGRRKTLMRFAYQGYRDRLVALISGAHQGLIPHQGPLQGDVNNNNKQTGT